MTPAGLLIEDPLTRVAQEAARQDVQAGVATVGSAYRLSGGSFGRTRRWRTTFPVAAAIARHRCRFLIEELSLRNSAYKKYMRTLLRRATTVPQRTTCNVLFIGKFSRSFQNPVSVNFNSNGTINQTWCLFDGVHFTGWSSPLVRSLSEKSSEIVAETRCFRAALISSVIFPQTVAVFVIISGIAQVFWAYSKTDAPTTPKPQKKYRMQSKMPFSAEDGISLRLC